MVSLVECYNRMDHCCCEPGRSWTIHSALKSVPFAAVSYLAPEVFALIGTVMAAFESHVVERSSSEWKHLRCHFHEGVALAGFARSLVALHHGEWLESLEHAVAGLVSGLCSYPVRKELREDFDAEQAENEISEPSLPKGQRLGTTWAAQAMRPAHLNRLAQRYAKERDL